MGDLNYTLDGAVAKLLEDHKQTNGRRFSTYMEGYAHINASFDEAMSDTKTVAQIVDYLWGTTKAGVIDGDYTAALDELDKYAKQATIKLLEMAAMTRKLKGGVVHEPKQTS
jgi:hypothetical protein